MKPAVAVLRQSRLRRVLAGHPTGASAPLALSTWTTAGRSASSSSRGAPRSPLSRPAWWPACGDGRDRPSCATGAWTCWPPTHWPGPSTTRSTPAPRRCRTWPATRSWTQPPDASTPTGDRSPISPWPSCVPGPQQAMLALGPPRSGKTSTLVVPNVRAAPGPVLVTSTKADVLQATLASRSQLGRCWLLGPTGTTEPPPGAQLLRWSPVQASISWDKGQGC